MSLTLQTTHGNIKIELFCELCPKACKNFLALAASGRYDNTIFHRNIKGIDPFTKVSSFKAEILPVLANRGKASMGNLFRMNLYKTSSMTAEASSLWPTADPTATVASSLSPTTECLNSINSIQLLVGYSIINIGN
jgi:hypothetical protein